MKHVATLGLASLLIVIGTHSSRAQQNEGPTNPKAQKTYATGMDWVNHRDYAAAIGSFRKADKQDDGHCVGCEKQLIKLGLETGDYKSADEAAQEMIANAPATDAKAVALAHDGRAAVLLTRTSQWPAMRTAWPSRI